MEASMGGGAVGKLTGWLAEVVSLSVDPLLV